MLALKLTPCDSAAWLLVFLLLRASIRKGAVQQAQLYPKGCRSKAPPPPRLLTQPWLQLARD